MHNRMELRWHLGVMGCLFVPLLAAMILFAIAAVKPSLAVDLASGGRRGHLLALGQSGQFNWIAGGVALLLGGAIFKTGWRWADMVAIRADDRGLAFHRSILRKPLAWNEVRAVTYVPVGETGSLIVETAAGHTFRISQVDPEQGPGFARAVTERWLALPPRPPAL